MIELAIVLSIAGSAFLLRNLLRRYPKLGLRGACTSMVGP
jgi:hypothetical protein